MKETIQTSMIKLLTFVLLFSHVALAGPFSSIDGDFIQMGDTIHVEFHGRSRWDYDLSRKEINGKDSIVLYLPKLNDTLVGKIGRWKGGLISSVQVNPKSINNRAEVIFTLSEKKVMAFDYLTDDPSRLIIDFYIDEEQSPVAPVLAQPQVKTEFKQAKVEKLPQKLPQKRKPASGEFIKNLENDKAKSNEVATSDSDLRHGIFDGGDPDFSRFSMKDYEIKEEAKIASQRNIYIVFPALKVERKQLQELIDTPPIYEIIPENTEENKVARLLLTLFNKKRYAVYLKTLEFFRKQFPQSKYDELVDFMEADVYYNQWLKNRGGAEYQKAISLYRSLVEKYPKSDLVERTLLLVAYSYLDKGDSLNTLMSLQRVLRYKPDSKYFDSVRLAVADAYQTLLKPADAIKTYNDLIEIPKSKFAPIAANYLMGDVYFGQSDFANAVSSYDKAIKAYPENWKEYPNAFYNKAESLFWLGKHKESLEAYREFLRRFPSHSHCGFAMTRLGELLETLGADQRRVVGAFLESYFRYRGSEGSRIARARIISHRMKDMRPKEVEASLKELEDIAKNSTLKEATEFITIMISDGYFSRGEYDESINKLISFYKENPTSPNLGVFKKRIVRSITEKVKTLVESGSAIKALKEYARHSDTWLKNDERIDIKYHLGKSLETLGVVGEAASVYRDIVNHLYAIKGTAAERERNIFETLPTIDSINLRLAAVAKKNRDYGGASDYISKITNPELLSDAEKIERVQIVAEVSDKKGDLNVAKENLKKLVDTWRGQPELITPVYLDLAKIEMRLKNFSDAQNYLQKILNLNKDTESLDKDMVAETLQLSGDSLLAQKKNAEAITVYQELLEKFDEQKKLDSVRFKLGKLMFEKGDIKGAEATWKSLQENPKNIWGKIATEKLKDMQFSQDYNKYIKRIPAMENQAKE